MTAGQVIVTVALLSRMYGVDPVVMDCIAYRESTPLTTPSTVSTRA